MSAERGWEIAATEAARKLARPEIRFDPGPHTYEVLKDGTWRRGFPSVTTITSVVPMPFAAGQWSGMKMGCEGIAVSDRAVVLAALDSDDPAGALYELMKATDHRPDRRLRAAGDRGTAIHNALEAWGREQIVPSPEDFAPEDHKLIQGIAKWLSENQPEFFEQETQTACLIHEYVGTFDAKVRFAAGEHTGKTALLDWKSSKVMSADKFFPQLEAYRAAERQYFDDVDLAMVVHLPESGRVKAHISTDTFDDFLVLLHHWRSAQARKGRGK